MYFLRTSFVDVMIIGKPAAVPACIIKSVYLRVLLLYLVPPYNHFYYPSLHGEVNSFISSSTAPSSAPAFTSPFRRLPATLDLFECLEFFNTATHSVMMALNDASMSLKVGLARGSKFKQRSITPNTSACGTWKTTTTWTNKTETNYKVSTSDKQKYKQTTPGTVLTSFGNTLVVNKVPLAFPIISRCTVMSVG